MEHNICKQCAKELEPKISHYQKYKETFAKYRNKEEVKEKFRAYRREYRKKDPERTKAQDFANYVKKKEDRINCDCGKQVMRINLKKHLDTKYHINHSK